MSSLKLGFVALSFALCVGATHTALAQTCTTDQDCPLGLACAVTGHLSETKPATRADLPAPPATSADTTSGTEIKSCIPRSCTSAADCGPGMLCHQQESTACSGGVAVAPCEKGTTCTTVAVPSETVCTTSITSQCLFQWQLPCNADNDCGEGFACQPSVIGSCGSSGAPRSTGGGTGNASGSAAGVGGTSGSTGSTPTAPDSSPAIDDGSGGVTCTTTTVFPGSCQPKIVSCVQDTDCPSPWTCQEIVTPSARDVASSGAGAAGGPTLSTRLCVSPYASLGTDVGKTNQGSSGPGATGGTTGSTSGGDTSDGSTRSGQPPTAAPVSAEESAQTGGGCALATSTATTSTSTGLGAAAFLLLALSARRRRR